MATAELVARASERHTIEHVFGQAQLEPGTGMGGGCTHGFACYGHMIVDLAPLLSLRVGGGEWHWFTYYLRLVVGSLNMWYSTYILVVCYANVQRQQ